MLIFGRSQGVKFGDLRLFLFLDEAVFEDDRAADNIGDDGQGRNLGEKTFQLGRVDAHSGHRKAETLVHFAVKNRLELGIRVWKFIARVVEFGKFMAEAARQFGQLGPGES